MVRATRRLLVVLGAVALLVGSAVAHQCPTTLGDCKIDGCNPKAKDSTSGLHIIVNHRKRTWPPKGQAEPLTLDDFASFQAAASKLISPPKKMLGDEDSRKLIKHLRAPSSNTFVSEGDLVQVAGYLVGLPKRPTAEQGEAVNCGLRGEKNSDYHIPIAREPTHSEFQAIVVEMIPQRRPASWTLDMLKGIATTRQQVLIRGQLFYDKRHLVNEDENNPKTGQPKRFSLWEVHPVTEFFVCEKSSCDYRDSGDWKEMGKVTYQKAGPE